MSIVQEIRLVEEIRERNYPASFTPCTIDRFEVLHQNMKGNPKSHSKKCLYICDEHKFGVRGSRKVFKEHIGEDHSI